jgi:hypothetical protein
MTFRYFPAAIIILLESLNINVRQKPKKTGRGKYKGYKQKLSRITRGGDMTAYAFEHLYDTGIRPHGRFDIIDLPDAFEEARIHREDQRFQEDMDATLKQALDIRR